MSEKKCVCGHELESGGFFSGLFGGRDDDKPRKNQRQMSRRNWTVEEK